MLTMKLLWRTLTGWAVVSGLLFSCQNKGPEFDASGVFEAEEIMVPAEVSGIIEKLNMEEGQTLEVGEVLGYIDSTQLYLKKKQLMAQLGAIDSRLPQIAVQTATFKKQILVIESQIASLDKEKRRIIHLLKVDAAVPKQLDDINGQLEVLERQLGVIQQQDLAQKSVLSTQTKGFQSEKNPLVVQIEQLNDQLRKCLLISPISGTVLTKYAYAKEMAVPGKTLYKMANLNTLVFRAYITGDQLPQIKLNQKVTVLTDSTKESYSSHTGIVTWISSKAEFTPKTIQTKDERANRVYAVKVLVENEGQLKIGMYGDLKFQ